MSASFEIFSPDHETVRIEILKDGNLYFPDNDIEYDITMTEFGEPETFAIQLFREWNSDRIEFILERLELSKQTIVMLAADFADHVLPLFEKEFPADGRPRKSIEGARIYASSIETEGERQNSIKAFELAMKADDARHMAAGSGTRSSLYAAYAAMSAGLAAGSHAPAENTVMSTASYAANAALNWNEEYNWQIRRFVDCMEALQAGKPWPPLEITK